MTTIFCSNKFRDFIGKSRLTTADSFIPCPFGDWNVHLFYFDRRKYLMCVNNKTYYCVIIDNITKAVLKDFETLFFNRLTRQLVFDKVIPEADTLIILQKTLPLRVAQTNNDKKAIGTMNDFIQSYKVYRETKHWFDKSLEAINSSLNDSLTGAGRNQDRQYGLPTEDMKTIIKMST